LLHVIDGSSPRRLEQRRAVEGILHDLELERAPRLIIYNKADLPAAERPEPETIQVSARTGAGLERLRDAIFERFS